MNKEAIIKTLEEIISKTKEIERRIDAILEPIFESKELNMEKKKNFT